MPEASNMDKTLMIVKQSCLLEAFMAPFSLLYLHASAPLNISLCLAFPIYCCVVCNFKLFYEQIVNV